jgi:hypothetical protein
MDRSFETGDFCTKKEKGLQTYSLKGQSHEKDGKMSVWGISLGPN